MKEIRNKEASVRSRLLNLSKEREVDYNALLRHYFQERLLARLAVSKFRDSFALKGSFLLLVYNVPGSRLTQDIDFLGIGAINDVELLRSIFQEISEINLNDCVTYNAQKIEMVTIKESADYQGQRIYIPCSMGAIKSRIQIDIGFGDKLLKNPREIVLPVLLAGDEDFRLNAYQIETSLAEKFESIVSLGMANSRMKDFYDIVFIALALHVNKNELSKSLKLTFGRRGNSLQNAHYILSAEFRSSPIMNKKWELFLSSRNLSMEFPFMEVITRIESFLKPCIDEPESNAVWNPEAFRWEKL